MRQPVPGRSRTTTSLDASARPRRALVLGAGGVLGFAWMIGALCALEQHLGVDAREVEFLVGTSAGAAVAALLGCGLSVDQIHRHHQGVPAPGDPVMNYDYDALCRNGHPPRPGLRPGSPHLVLQTVCHPRRGCARVALAGVAPEGRGSLAPLARLIEDVTELTGQCGRWPQRPRPWLVAVDYVTGQRVVFGRDGEPGQWPVSLADAVVASCSIPAWYPPTVVGGHRYIDGGTVSNTSADLLLDEPVDEVYVLAPMAADDGARPHSPVARLEHAMFAGIARGVRSDVARLRRAGKQVTVVAPDPADLAVMGTNLMDSRRRAAVLEAAERNVAAQLRSQAVADVSPA